MTETITNNFLKKVSNKPILLVGPTASGKSKFAMSLAIKLERQIVNADSLQVYNNCRILTARPTSEDEAIIQHHLYGHKAPDEEYSVGHWLRELSGILNTNKNLIIVGGTGLYFKALTEGLVEFPNIPYRFRQKIRILQKKLGSKKFYLRLVKEDPLVIDNIDPSDTQRIIRAYEIKLFTKKSKITVNEKNHNYFSIPTFKLFSSS